MDDEGCFLILFFQPGSVILRDDRVAVAVTGSGGTCSVWGELEVADEGFELFTGFGAGELDADDAALEELGYLGAFELRRLRDDGESVVAGGLDGVGQVGRTEEDVFVFDVDEVETRLLVVLDDRGSDDFAEDSADHDLARFETEFELAAGTAFRVEVGAGWGG